MRDFSFELRPADIIAQSNAAINKMQDNNEVLDDARNYANTYINVVQARELNSQGYRNIEKKMRDFKKVIEGLQQANDLDISDHNKLIGAVGSENLIGSFIETMVRTSNTEIDRLNTRISDLDTKIGRGCYCGSQGFSEALFMRYGVECTCILNARASRTSAISMRDIRIDIRDYWLEKAAKYDEIEANTKILFEKGRAVRTEAIRGIGLIIQAADGLPNRYSSGGGLSSWRSSMLEEIENAEAKLYLLDELGVTRQVLREMKNLGYSASEIVALWDSLETWENPEFVVHMREAELRAERTTRFAHVSDEEFEEALAFNLGNYRIIIDLWPAVEAYTLQDFIDYANGVPGAHRNPMHDIIFLTDVIFFDVAVEDRIALLDTMTRGRGAIDQRDIDYILGAGNHELDYIQLQWLYAGPSIGLNGSGEIWQAFMDIDHQNQLVGPITNAVGHFDKPKSLGQTLQSFVIKTLDKEIETFFKDAEEMID